MAKVWFTLPLLNLPTAQMLLAAEAATAFRSSLGPRLGLGTRVQWEPSQCSIRVWPAVLPTAQVSVAEVPATLSRALATVGPPGSGVATRTHFWPFQCSARVWLTPPATEPPTAQYSVAEVPLTLLRKATVPGLGLGTWAQLWPFQCRVSVLSVSEVEV